MSLGVGLGQSGGGGATLQSLMAEAYVLTDSTAFTHTVVRASAARDWQNNSVATNTGRYMSASVAGKNVSFALVEGQRTKLNNDDVNNWTAAGGATVTSLGDDRYRIFMPASSTLDSADIFNFASTFHIVRVYARLVSGDPSGLELIHMERAVAETWATVDLSGITGENGGKYSEYTGTGTSDDTDGRLRFQNTGSNDVQFDCYWPSVEAATYTGTQTDGTAAGGRNAETLDVDYSTLPGGDVDTLNGTYVAYLLLAHRDADENSAASTILVRPCTGGSDAIQVEADGDLIFRRDGASDAGGTVANATVNLAANDMHTLGLTWDHGSNRGVVYVNGVEQIVSGFQTGLAGDGSGIDIGHNGGSEHLFGAVALLYWPRTLTAAEMTTIHNVRPGLDLTRDDPPGVGYIVAEGDSLTALLANGGVGASQWPALLDTSNAWSVHNVAVGGSFITDAREGADTAKNATDATRIAAITTLYNQWVSEGSLGSFYLIPWLGSNDLTVEDDEEAVLTELRGIVATYAANYPSATIILCNMIARGNAVAQTLTDYNTAIAAAVADAGDSLYNYTLVDLAGDARLADETDLTYFTADEVHLQTAGQQAVAELIADAIGIATPA